MKRLLIKADDLGYSEAVNLGIERAIRGGLVRSTGLMANMPAAAHGIGLLAGYDVAIGQHTNICVGRPVSDPADVPSLVTSDGRFKTSSVYRSSNEDFVRYEDAVREIEAQLGRFRALTGHDPAYFEGHAVASEQFFRALEDVAAREGLKLCMPALAGRGDTVGETKVVRCKMESMEASYDPVATLKRAVDALPDDRVGIFTCHPGYLDDYLLTHSSLTVNRTKEVAMLCDPSVRAWLAEEGVELVDYRTL